MPDTRFLARDNASSGHHWLRPGWSTELPFGAAPAGVPVGPRPAHGGGDACGGGKERRLRNVITEGLGIVLDRRRSVTAAPVEPCLW